MSGVYLAFVEFGSDALAQMLEHLDFSWAQMAGVDGWELPPVVFVLEELA